MDKEDSDYRFGRSAAGMAASQIHLMTVLTGVGVAWSNQEAAVEGLGWRQRYLAHFMGDGCRAVVAGIGKLRSLVAVADFPVHGHWAYHG